VANRSGSAIDIVHVLSKRSESAESSDLSGSIGLGARSSLLGELAELDAQNARLALKRGRAILDDAQSIVTGQDVEEVHTKLRHGEIVETVQELEADVDLIVIGKRGEAADFNTLHLGSNLERVVRATTQPVLVASREFKPISRFLIAFDGGPSSMKAIEFLAAKSQYQDLACHVLMVGSDNTENRRQLEGAQATLTNGGFTVSGDIQEGEPETVITQAVEQVGFELVIMGAYGHSRIRNLIIGSTTTQMMRSCKVPLLLFR
jgi:nucleotide-binding universal stress UspA family protein